AISQTIISGFLREAGHAPSCTFPSSSTTPKLAATCPLGGRPRHLSCQDLSGADSGLGIREHGERQGEVVSSGPPLGLILRSTSGFMSDPGTGASHNRTAPPVSLGWGSARPPS